MALAVVAAGFTPGEADKLRRAMAAWKRKGDLMKRYGEQLVEGMVDNGYDEAFAQRIFRQLFGGGKADVVLAEDQPVLDLPYLEDRDASVDFNVVMTGSGQYVEVQGTGEEATFSEEQLGALLNLAKAGCREISSMQTAFLTQRLLVSSST